VFVSKVVHTIWEGALFAACGGVSGSVEVNPQGSFVSDISEGLKGM
jgi:hypothetical protein